MIDTGTAAVIGSVLVLAGTVFTTRGAARKGQQEAQEEREHRAAPQDFAQNLDLHRLIREQVREETRELRSELADVKRVLGNLYGRLDRIREAVREYIRQVRVQWGKSEEPPPVDGHLADLLGDLDEDTWTAAKVADLVAQSDAPHDDGNDE